MTKTICTRVSKEFNVFRKDFANKKNISMVKADRLIVEIVKKVNKK